MATGQGVLGYNMFCYCGNSPITRVDSYGTFHALAVGGVKGKKRPPMVPRKDSRKGSDKRKPSGDRERNVGHPNGEEHSRVPKGNRQHMQLSEDISAVAIYTGGAEYVVDVVTVSTNPSISYTQQIPTDVVDSTYKYCGTVTIDFILGGGRIWTRIIVLRFYQME